MDRQAVRLTVELRRVALIALVITLVGDGIEVLIASLDDHHLHVLARFRDHETRRRMGWAKLQATKRVKEALAAMQTHGDAVGFDLHLDVGDGIWAKGTKAEPVRDRSHQLNVIPYIYDHIGRGAVVYMGQNVERHLRRHGKLA